MTVHNPSSVTPPEPDWAGAKWAHYDFVFYTDHTRADRKACIRKMMRCGLSARDAIQEMRDYEREP